MRKAVCCSWDEGGQREKVRERERERKEEKKILLKKKNGDGAVKWAAMEILNLTKKTFSLSCVRVVKWKKHSLSPSLLSISCSSSSISWHVVRVMVMDEREGGRNVFCLKKVIIIPFSFSSITFSVFVEKIVKISVTCFRVNVSEREREREKDRRERERERENVGEWKVSNWIKWMWKCLQNNSRQE